MRNFKSCYFNIYPPSAKFLSLLIFVYCLSLSVGCRNISPVPEFSVRNQTFASENAVNINTASVAELEKLPRVGVETSKKIVDFREKYGKFRRIEDLILVRGMSDKKFRSLRNLVKVE